MVQNSKIEWTHHTFSPWLGCTKVSEACKFCYAETWAKRSGLVQWGPEAPRRLTSNDNWRQPLKWQREAQEMGARYRVFCASLSDVFDDHPSILPDWRERLWVLIERTPNLDWLLLTKRPENWPFFLPVAEPRPPFENIRLGVTIENQERADERGGPLTFASAVGWPTFVSYEPALGPVDWARLMPSVDWLISGGESGAHARPSHPGWFRAARDAAAQAGVPFLHKQNGEWVSVSEVEGEGEHFQFPDYATVRKIGKKAAGRTLDGVTHDGFPT